MSTDQFDDIVIALAGILQAIALIKETTGICSAVLWKQMGGSRFQILFSRASIKNTAEKLLKKIELEQSQPERISYD